ncbi:MAG TPA: hypothetical protein VN446_06365 [Candidatus Acidoferrum sp.]|nr:hypothetical protein [Candidatus Acidoferrum sp.]
MTELAKRRNLLIETGRRDRSADGPNYYRAIFPYTEVPRVTFDAATVPMNPPDELWITDTTFRDGQQSRAPYSVEQIVELYKLMSRLGGPKGVIRQCEFFLYSERDRQAVEKCRELGLAFPEITGWIRATKGDFELAKAMGLAECGILVSCSDYHIFKKLKKTRAQAMAGYLEVVRAALELGMKPRCHFEDITRADFHGFVVPFARELQKLAEESKIDIKIRACDTLGYGVPYAGAALPRSVPGLIGGLCSCAGFTPDRLEWHGHNDFHKAVVNSTTAWLYGASGVNCSLLGIGERTGNTPLEAMVMEYAQLRGTLDGMDTTAITDIAEYYQTELGYTVPASTPFIGSAFNTTSAGIHADGLLKDEEIYNIFDTGTLLKCPPGVAVNSTSGLAGIAVWLARHLGLTPGAVDKNDAVVKEIKTWVDAQYAAGRVTTISPGELAAVYDKIHMDERRGA